LGVLRWYLGIIRNQQVGGSTPLAGSRNFRDNSSIELSASCHSLPLTSKDLTPVPPFPVSGPDSSMHEIQYRIDPIIRRCVAKITFNYMAYMAGAHFVYHPDFNVTRSFIRYGDSPSYPLVVPTQDPVLASESPRWRGTNNHLITVNWSPLGRSVVGQVSLFNEVTYKVSLARDFSGLWLDIRTGHCFDIKKRRVRPLVYSRLRRGR